MIDNGHTNIFAIRGWSGRTPLHCALEKFDLDNTTIKMMLKTSGMDINQPDDNGSTPLLRALNGGRSVQTIKSLIELGANIYIKDKYGDGVFHLAVVAGNKELILLLISQGLDVNEKGKNGDTPLHLVVMTTNKNYFEMTKFLLDNGADLFARNDKAETLAHQMSSSTILSCDDFKSWVNAMIKNNHGHLFSCPEYFGKTPLHSAMMYHDLDLKTIKLISESAKLDINQADNERSTILHLALYYGRSLDTIKNLVKLGADWKKKGKDGRSVLHYAVEGCNKEAFLYMKSLGADVNETNKDGETPLHRVRWAQSSDYFGMTKFLLENGANLNAKDDNGRNIGDLISSCDWISSQDYEAWKTGMVNLGHAAFFQT